MSGAVDDQLFADLHDQGPGSPYETDIDQEAGEITGVGGNTGLDLRWLPATGGDSTLIGPTQGGRNPHFSNDPNRVYLSGNQGLVHCDWMGWIAERISESQVKASADRRPRLRTTIVSHATASEHLSISRINIFW